MRYFRFPTMIVGLILALATSTHAQADAQKAYQAAKAAYAAGKFAEARAAAEKAAQTDPQNAEAFLLLGQAQYQLGELDQALESWKKTLALAPQEPLAAKMLDALRAQRAGVADRIKLIEALLAEKLYGPVLAETKKCLADKALSPAARVQLLVLQAESHIRMANSMEAQKLLHEASVLYPQEADKAKNALLTGLAKLIAPDTATEGTAMLKKIAAEKPDSPLGKTAQYELAVFALGQETTPATLDTLAKWLKENSQDRRAEDVKAKLIAAYLTLSRQVELPGPEAKLNQYDRAALALAAEALSAAVRADSANAIARPILEHLEKHYAFRGARAAELAGLETLLKSPLGRENRLAALKAVAASKSALAMNWIREQARLGMLPAAAPPGDLPEALKDAVAASRAIHEEYPFEPSWQTLLKLAEEVRRYAPAVSWPDKVEQLRGPDAWSISMALMLLSSPRPDSAAVQPAVDFLMKAAEELSKGPQPKDGEDFPLAISRKAMEALAGHQKHSVWPNAVKWHCEWLSKGARKRFQENVKKGDFAANAAVAEAQNELLRQLESLVKQNIAYSSLARNILSASLQPWKDAEQWAPAEELQQKLAQVLSPAERLLAEIDIANLWIERADRARQKLLQAGLAIPKELDPLHRKALMRLYELQAGLPETSPSLPAIRMPWQKVVAQYKALEYFDAAAEAIQVKAEKAVPLADEFAAFQLLVLRTEQAQRAFDVFVKQYRAPDQWSLLPEHKNLLAAWEKFIADHPAGTFVSQAAGQVLNLGQLYERQTAFDVAAGIYAEFAQFAGGQKILSQDVPGRASVAEKVAFAAAAALDAHARKALARWAADRKPEAAPPEKLSAEFAAAISEYKKFLEKEGDRPSAAAALQKIMAVAAEYAKYNAWDVAEGIYADLLGTKLKLNRPERLEFARGLCRLGPALPDHARTMLSAISLGEHGRAGGDKAGEEMPAWHFSDFDEKSAVALDRAAKPADAISAGGVLSDGKPGGGAYAVNAPSPATPGAAGYGYGGLGRSDSTTIDLPREAATRDSQLLAMVNQEEKSRAQRVAQMRENSARRAFTPQQSANQQPMKQQVQQGVAPPPTPALSEAELARQEKALAAAFAIFTLLRKNYPQTPTAEQARGEILVMAAHWRGLQEWQRAAALVQRFLADNPADPQLPQLRLEIARDRLSHAAKPLAGRATRQEMLAEVEKRFEEARGELGRLQADFPSEKALQQSAQWDIAMSYLTQARAIDVVSPTLAQGQYVRTAKELRQIASKYPDHPRLGEIPQLLWSIGQELDARGYNEEAIAAWSELVRYDPLNNLAAEALMRIAQTYQMKLKRPLRAAEAYQELNFIRGGNDAGLQNTIFQIGAELKNERRWVESLHVLETFVDSFPRHPQAVQALTMIGQIHQTNEAWSDAMTAFCRVIDEYPAGQWVQEARWSIAECTINLSQWKEAAGYYRAFVEAYPGDGKVAEANRRIDILKDLERYQGLIDEKDQRKAFDAQFQIGEIVRKQLNNPVKAIVEYRKVFANWPESYLAGDALFAVGETYLSLGELMKARENLRLVAEKYPTSPSAGNAMFLVGKSYEDEADKLAKVTRAESLEKSKDVAQRGAYAAVLSSRKAMESEGQKRVAELKAAGKGALAEVQEAANAAGQIQLDYANVQLFAQKASQQVETMTALELADRQDKVNAALRKAIAAYEATSKIAGGNKADSALLQMATIYDRRLKDSKAAMQVWLEIVRQFSGTNVAEDASWKIAQYHEREGKFAEAVDAYQSFLRNYRRSPNAGAAQYAIAENYEHLGQWVKAMDSYTNYLTNFPEGPLANKAKQQINWIKTYRL
ncbi:MAG: tetratricopeptide repeat protein [Pirellulales bacterium]|nr:tetratricopeptide repeat protein [Pirellulales bacterium]